MAHHKKGRVRTKPFGGTLLERDGNSARASSGFPVALNAAEVVSGQGAIRRIACNTVTIRYAKPGRVLWDLRGIGVDLVSASENGINA
jgi:hypothetical protein